MTTLPSPRIGMSGLGTMGRPMALNLRRRRPDLDLVVAARNRDRVREVLDAGATFADSSAELAARSDVVILVVPSIHEVREVSLGPGGLIDGVSDHDLLVVVSSTCAGSEMRQLDVDLRARTHGRARVVDAPVSGGEEGAVAGTLSIMMGGEQLDCERASLPLAAMGRPVRLGAIGAGQVAKACNQMIVAAEVMALAEAAVVAERSGLDVRAMFELLGGGYAGSRVMESKATRFATHDHSPSGAAKFMIKDLRAAMESASDTGTELVLAPHLLAAFQAITDAGWGDLDTSVAQAYVEQLRPDEAAQND